MAAPALVMAAPALVMAAPAPRPIHGAGAITQISGRPGQASPSKYPTPESMLKNLSTYWSETSLPA